MKLYTITGRYIIEALQAPCKLETAITKAIEYTMSWTSGNPLTMTLTPCIQALQQEHPLVYSVGFFVPKKLEMMQLAVKEGDWHEICRIEEHSPYMGTAIIPADRVNEEFEKATTWPDGGKGYDLSKKGNAQYVHRDTQLAWQHWLSGWRKAEQVL